MRRKRDEGDDMQIRPHHILCIGNYVGKGYSEKFTANMDGICERLKNGEPFILTKGKDDVCAACPFLEDGVCKTVEKTDRYDESVCAALGLKYGEKYVYDELERKAEERIYGSRGLSFICGDCEWHDLCDNVRKNK